MDYSQIPVPRSEFGSLVSRRLNDIRQFQRAGMMFSEGPTGCGYSPLPVNMRNRSSSGIIQPWTFKCTVDPDTEERIGGWYNQVVQIGMRGYRHDAPEDGFTDETECADGYHYLEVETAKITWQNRNSLSNYIKIKRYDSEQSQSFDETTGFVRFFLGKIEDGGEYENTCYHNPIVIYIYL